MTDSPRTLCVCSWMADSLSGGTGAINFVACSRDCREAMDRAQEAEYEYAQSVRSECLLHVCTGFGDTYLCLRDNHSWLGCEALKQFYRAKAALSLMFGAPLIYESGGTCPLGGVVLLQWIDEESGELYTLRIGGGLFSSWSTWVCVRQLEEPMERMW